MLPVSDTYVRWWTCPFRSSLSADRGIASVCRAHRFAVPRKCGTFPAFGGRPCCSLGSHTRIRCVVDAWTVRKRYRAVWNPHHVTNRHPIVARMCWMCFGCLAVVVHWHRSPERLDIRELVGCMLANVAYAPGTMNRSEHANDRRPGLAWRSTNHR